MKLANITPNTNVDGGIIHLKDGECTGLLVDNAMNSVFSLIPEFPKKEMIRAMLDVQNELYQFGITGVHEAGIDNKDIAFFKELIDLWIRSYNREYTFVN